MWRRVADPGGLPYKGVLSLQWLEGAPLSPTGRVLMRAERDGGIQVLDVALRLEHLRALESRTVMRWEQPPTKEGKVVFAPPGWNTHERWWFAHAGHSTSVSALAEINVPQSWWFLAWLMRRRLNRSFAESLLWMKDEIEHPE